MTTTVLPMLALPVLLTLACASGSDEGLAPVGPPPAAVPANIDPDIAAQLAELLTAAQQDPDDAERRARLGMAYEVAGLASTAERCYRQAVQLEPSEPRWAYYLALVRAAQGDLAGGLESLQSVAALDATYTPAWLYRGQWLLDLGQVDAAREVYQRVTALDSDSHSGWVGLARAHLKLGQYDRAARILENVAQDYPHPQVFQLLGLAYRETGNLEQARAALARGRPGPPPGWPDPWNRAKVDYVTGFGAGLRRAEVLLARGKAPQAIELLESLRATHADDVALLNNLSVAYGQIGDRDGALEVLRQGLERHPDYYPFHLNIANRYRERGDLDRALEHLDRAIAINPTLGWAFQQKATYLRESGRLEAARDAIDTALTLDATSATWFLYAARLEADLGDWARAALRAEQAVHIDPSSAPSLLLLTRAQLELGELAAARETLDQATRLGADPSALVTLRELVDP